MSAPASNLPSWVISELAQARLSAASLSLTSVIPAMRAAGLTHFRFEYAGNGHQLRADCRSLPAGRPTDGATTITLAEVERNGRIALHETPTDLESALDSLANELVDVVHPEACYTRGKGIALITADGAAIIDHPKIESAYCLFAQTLSQVERHNALSNAMLLEDFRQPLPLLDRTQADSADALFNESAPEHPRPG